MMPGTRLRMVKTDNFPEIPALRLFFTVDDEEFCTLQQVELRDEDTGDC